MKGTQKLHREQLISKIEYYKSMSVVRELFSFSDKAVLYDGSSNYAMVIRTHQEGKREIRYIREIFSFFSLDFISPMFLVS